MGVMTRRRSPGMLSVMNALAMELMEQAGPLARQASPLMLVTIIALVLFALSGIPGRTKLGLETQLQLRRERRGAMAPRSGA